MSIYHILRYSQINTFSINIKVPISYLGIEFGEHFEVPFEICGKDSFYHQEPEALEFTFLKIPDPVKPFI